MRMIDIYQIIIEIWTTPPGASLAFYCTTALYCDVFELCELKPL